MNNELMQEIWLRAYCAVLSSGEADAYEQLHVDAYEAGNRAVKDFADRFGFREQPHYTIGSGTAAPVVS